MMRIRKLGLDWKKRKVSSGRFPMFHRITPRALTPRVKAEVEVASVAWQSEERSNLSANPDQLGIDT